MKLEPYWSSCIDCLNLNLKKEKKYMCEDKWMFSINQKTVCLKKKFVIKKKKGLFKRKGKLTKRFGDLYLEKRATKST